MFVAHTGNDFSRGVPFDGLMAKPKCNPAPALELRCGVVHLTIQRVPGWLVAVLATTMGSGLTAWLTSR